MMASNAGSLMSRFWNQLGKSWRTVKYFSSSSHATVTEYFFVLRNRCKNGASEMLHNNEPQDELWIFKKVSLTGSTFLDVRMLGDPFSELAQRLRSQTFIFSQLFLCHFFEFRWQRALVWIILIGLCFQIWNGKSFGLQHWKGNRKLINHYYWWELQFLCLDAQWKCFIVIILSCRTNVERAQRAIVQLEIVWRK